MAMTPRLLAPVAAPPPPKPPQLNLVASALMPDVDTDTLGPAAPSLLASGGFSTDVAVESARPRRRWHREPGHEGYRAFAEEWNALVAAVGVMSDVELKQAEADAGVTPDSLPKSLFQATNSSSRWTDGFAWAPENQARGQVADPCGQAIDLPALTPPAVAATPITGTGTLGAATYHYFVTEVTANGESVPTAAVNAVLASTGEVRLTMVSNRADVTAFKIYGRTTAVVGSADLIATVAAAPPGVPTVFTDDGSISPAPPHPPAADTSAGPGFYGNLQQLGFVPFLIQVEDECSVWGWEERDFTGRALRLLDNATPNAIEREFWTGAFARNTFTGPIHQTDGPNLNAFLQETATATNGGAGVAAADLTPIAGPPSVTRGIQILEDYLANTGFGGQGMLHVAPETSPNLLGARRVGALLLSVMDNIIVPGSGYPTSGSTGPIGNGQETPAAGTQWIYATDLVSVRLDDPTIYPATLAEALDRGLGGQPNTIRFRASRFAAATFDVSRLAAVRVALSA